MKNNLFKESQKGLVIIKNTILKLLMSETDGLTNSQIARILGLESSHEGNQKDYLTYSVLGILMSEGKVKKLRDGRTVLYVAIK